MNLFVLWINSTGNPKYLRMAPEEIYKKAFICECHFTKEQLDDMRRNIKLCVPSLHLPDPLNYNLTEITNNPNIDLLEKTNDSVTLPFSLMEHKSNYIDSTYKSSPKIQRIETMPEPSVQHYIDYFTAEVQGKELTGPSIDHNVDDNISSISGTLHTGTDSSLTISSHEKEPAEENTIEYLVISESESDTNCELSKPYISPDLNKRKDKAQKVILETLASISSMEEMEVVESVLGQLGPSLAAVREKLYLLSF
ncbi:uncharacterized protein LOC115889507 isoform X2 [Sitophilus oryzae]|nr:uncharacterized protein LOC115889507 isoform X2 [Sitophilus oryzae]